MKVTLLTIIVVILIVANFYVLGERQENHKRNIRLRQIKRNDIGGNGGGGFRRRGGGGIRLNGYGFKRRNHNNKFNKDDGNSIITDIPGSGKVKGRIANTLWSGKVIHQYYDIKYGQSPSGGRRFKAPVAVVPWKHIRLADKARRGCPSLQDMTFIRANDGKRDLEDCLTLSIHTKSYKEPVPVMVYLHGEFLYEGTPQEAAPGYLLEKDIVLVNVRYRLGPFGFLSTQTERIPGNAAVFDIILALEWVQKNIHAFGGDPKRVTLFGQVGGAALANVLTMSPVVREGLFHQVIYQSGSALTPAFVTDSPTEFTKDIAREGGCKDLDSIKKLNSCLAKMNVTTLLQAFSNHGLANADKGIGFYGGVQFVIGGPSGVLPDHPGKLIGDNKIRYYPTMGGVVKNSGTFLLREIFEDNFNDTIPDKIFNATSYIDYIIAHTNGDDSNDAWTSFVKSEFFTKEEMKNGTFSAMLPGLIDMCGTIPFKNPVLLALQANAEKLPNQTFLYSFNYEGEYNRYHRQDYDDLLLPFDFGVSLTDENLYLFPWPKYASALNYKDNRIARKMVDLWTSFATNGIPKSDKIPNWPSMVNGSAGPYLKIDRVSKVEESFLNEYSITVTEHRNGLSLISEEYFENIQQIQAENVEIEMENQKIKDENGKRKKQKDEENEADDNDDDDDDEYNEDDDYDKKRLKTPNALLLQQNRFSKRTSAPVAIIFAQQ